MKRVEASESDYQALVSGAVPQLKSILAILQSKNSVFHEEIDYANSVLEDAGTYLSSRHDFSHYIRAEAEGEITVADVKLQKEFIERLRNLISEVTRLLQVQNPNRAGNVLHIVHDTCSDYKHVLNHGRQEANRRRITKKIERLRNHVHELCELLEDDDVAHQTNFESAYALYRKRVHGDSEEPRPFWELQNELKFFSWHLELETHRAKTQPETVYVPDNQAKRHLVDAAYELALDSGFPRFVTTPGSDFGYLCSILYEIATGTGDESLAGAINRYARSKARTEADEYKIEYGEERERARDEDNFFDIKKSALDAEKRARELTAELRGTELSQEARMLIFIEFEECRKLVEDQHKVHGPFIVWASQMKRDWPTELSELEEIDAAKGALDIKLGKYRRSKPKST